MSCRYCLSSFDSSEVTVGFVAPRLRLSFQGYWRWTTPVHPLLGILLHGMHFHTHHGGDKLCFGAAHLPCLSLSPELTHIPHTLSWCADCQNSRNPVMEALYHRSQALWIPVPFCSSFLLQWGRFLRMPTLTLQGGISFLLSPASFMHFLTFIIFFFDVVIFICKYKIKL